MQNNSTGATNKNIVLIIALVSSFLANFQTSSIFVALPRMAAELHMEAVAMSWTTTIFMLAVAMVQVPMGRLADIYGRRKLYLLGLVISILASALGAVSSSGSMLLLSRAFQGFSAGIIFNNIIAILTSVFPPDKRGRALGISMTGTYSGLIIGPLLGGFLTERLGWQSIFVLVACASFLLLGLAFLALKGEWREARGEKFDIGGSLLYGVAIAMSMYGFSVLPTIPGIVLFLAGMVGLLLFVRLELQSPSPILDFRIFKNNRIFVFSNVASLINYLATFAITFLLSLYLQYIKGLSAETAGLVLISSSVPMTIFTPIAGRLSDRIEPRLVAATGLIVSCVALLLLIFLNNGTPLGYIIFSLVLYGMGIGLFSSPNSNAVMGSVEKKALGVASGTIATMRTAGMMLSMGIMMILFAAFIGQAEITPAYYPQFLISLRVGFIVFATLSALGVVIQLAGRKKV